MTKRRRKRTNANVPAKGRLRDFCDKLWSLAVRDDWAWRCAVCGSRDELNAHHLIPREHTATRYAMRNGICLCSRCHKFCTERSPHQNAAGWLRWLKEHHPALAEWYCTGTAECWGAPPITKNVQYYCEVIRELRVYVDEDEFRRIVGVRFADWLTDSD